MHAPAGAAPEIERGENRNRPEWGKKPVRVGSIHFNGPSIWPACQVRETRETGQCSTESRMTRMRSPTPLDTRTEQDDFRLDLLQFLVPQTEPLEDSRREVLDDNISPG